MIPIPGSGADESNPHFPPPTSRIAHFSLFIFDEDLSWGTHTVGSEGRPTFQALRLFCLREFRASVIGVLRKGVHSKPAHWKCLPGLPTASLSLSPALSLPDEPLTPSLKLNGFCESPFSK